MTLRTNLPHPLFNMLYWLWRMPNMKVCWGGWRERWRHLLHPCWGARHQPGRTCPGRSQCQVCSRHTPLGCHAGIDCKALPRQDNSILTRTHSAGLVERKITSWKKPKVGKVLRTSRWITSTLCSRLTLERDTLESAVRNKTVKVITCVSCDLPLLSLAEASLSLHLRKLITYKSGRDTKA